MILRLLAQPVNVVLTAHVGDVYDKSGQTTGAKVPRAQKQSLHMVDLGIFIRKSFDPIAKRWKYMATMKKCRFKRGFEFGIEDITYDTLVKALKDKLGVVIPKTTALPGAKKNV